MNKDRSPLRGTVNYFIGIILLLLGVIPTTFTSLTYNKIDSKHETEDLTEATTEVTTEETVEEEGDTTIADTTMYFSYPSDVVIARRNAAYQKWIDNEEYLPTLTKIEKHKVMAAEAEKSGTEVYSVEKNTPIATTQSEYTYYACYQLTAYCATGNPCADGTYPSVGYTVASNDPNLWHKWICIEGYGNYYVHDTGGMSSNVIDVFMGSYGECINFGRRSANIYIIN